MIKPRLLLCVMTLGALILALSRAPEARAADARIFEVHDVPVDATAAGATAARDQAFATGQAQAFDILLRRLSLKADWPRLPASAGQDFKRLISGFAVADEKRSSTRYIAKVTYVFSPDRIRSILRGAGVPFSETRSKPVAVLPLVETADGKDLLWEPENPWAKVWRGKPLGQALVPFTVPAIDPADQTAPVAAQLDNPSWAQLEPVATRLGAASVIVPRLTLRRAGDQVQGDVRLIEVKPGKTSESHVSATGADENAAMANAVDAISDAAAESWKQTTAVADTAPATLVADVSYSDLAGWLRVRRALTGVPLVKGLRVIALAAEGAEVEISYVGTSNQLALGLAQQDLTMAGGEDGHYLISSSAPPPAPPDAAPATAAPAVPAPAAPPTPPKP